VGVTASWSPTQHSCALARVEFLVPELEGVLLVYCTVLWLGWLRDQRRQGAAMAGKEKQERGSATSSRGRTRR